MYRREREGDLLERDEDAESRREKQERTLLVNERDRGRKSRGIEYQKEEDELKRFKGKGEYIKRRKPKGDNFKRKERGTW